jgi:predicted kinase
MSGLRPYPELQAVLDAMEPPGHRPVGWSILCVLARSQLRRGCSVVLDGVARTSEASHCRALASEENARFILIMTECDDAGLHRERVAGRQRRIPNWYELDWDHLQGRGQPGSL